MNPLIQLSDPDFDNGGDGDGESSLCPLVRALVLKPRLVVLLLAFSASTSCPILLPPSLIRLWQRCIHWFVRDFDPLNPLSY
jgi:hypothetical protein